MKNATKRWRHHDVDDIMCNRRRFENAKIGLGNVLSTLVNTQLSMKFSEIVYA